jgi:succinyl-CoA synthetase beta subunit
MLNATPGIIRCDMIAESIIAAAAQIGPLRVPLVVRLQGTNSEAGLKLVCRDSPGIFDLCLPQGHRLRNRV